MTLFNSTRPLTAAVLTICALCSPLVASAHEYSALLKANKFDEVDRATQAKLATEPNNVEALLGRGDWLLSQGGEARIEDAIKLAERCVTAQPARSECHEAVGNAMGSKAMSAGMFWIMGNASKIRDAFKKAVELDPKNVDARFSLLQFYMQAPSVAGGGKDKAQALIAETTKVSADAAKLMQAQMDASDKEFAKAEAVALAPLSGDAADLIDRQRGLLVNLANAQLREKRFAEATRLFAEVQKRYPANEWGNYGMARTLQEQGKHSDALGWFEKSMAQKPGAHVHYRMAQSWQALSEKTKAIAAYERALKFKPELNGKQRTDAQDQLKSLSS